jgi:seryl-tRNA synthetase
MQVKVSSIRLQYTESNKAEIVLTTDTARLDISELRQVIEKGKELVADIKQYRKKRSLDSNAYLWQLCQKIAEAIRTTKEEVYKKAIREVGQFEIVPIKDEAVERWLEVWKGKGLGWFAEVMEDSKLPGYKKVISYYGSSVYDSREMSVLINYIVDECRELGIETLPPEEIRALNEAWGK